VHGVAGLKVNVWRGQAGHLVDSLSKGDQVMVTGRLRQRSRETPEGDKRSVTEIRRSVLPNVAERTIHAGCPDQAVLLRCPNPRPNVVDVVDREVDDALARSFLAELPTELAGRLRAEGERADYPAGTTVYRAGSAPQAALVVRGLIRVYLSSPGGRQVTVRYARPGDVLGIAVLVGGPASVGVQTVEPSSVFRISARTLTAAARRDPRVSWAIAEELNRRLYAVLEQTAVNAFGSVRQRVAAHLLDLASDRQRPRGRLVAHVSQQELADAAGSVREVVARALRDLRAAGIVATAADSVVILDPARLYAESGGPAGL
jgi:CRP/FNR family cyclic AMP-dependent transcriptional regulator